MAASMRRADDSRSMGDAHAALWERIDARLAARIASGELRPGERLPSEHLLAEHFKVNRHTVRQALGSLAARGLVNVVHGRGTFVAEFAVDYALGRRTRFSENLAATGVSGRHRLLESEEVSATPPIASALRCRVGTRVLRLLTLGEARGRPLSLGEHFFVARRFPGLMEAFHRLGSITRALAECGVTDFTRHESRITARLPGEEVARHLGQPAGRPALHVEALNVDPEGKPVEFGRTWFSGDRVQLVVAPDT